MRGAQSCSCSRRGASNSRRALFSAFASRLAERSYSRRLRSFGRTSGKQVPHHDQQDAHHAPGRRRDESNKHRLGQVKPAIPGHPGPPYAVSDKNSDNAGEPPNNEPKYEARIFLALVNILFKPSEVRLSLQNLRLRSRYTVRRVRKILRRAYRGQIKSGFLCCETSWGAGAYESRHDESREGGGDSCLVR